MRRREFISLVGAAGMWPLAPLAQQTDNKLRRISWLSALSADDSVGKAARALFSNRLHDLGWIEGRSLRIDYARTNTSDVAAIRASSKELVSSRPDLLVTSILPLLAALAEETSTIPIVFTTIPDPVGNGFTNDLGHPSRNMTGFTDFEFSMGGKWLQLIKELAPNVTGAMVLFNPATAPQASLFLRSIEAPSSSFAMEISRAPVHDVMELDDTIRALAARQNMALIIISEIFAFVNRTRIISLAADLRLPAIYPYKVYASDGGLISYGADIFDQFPRAADYADRILRGAKPSDLPIQQPTKFELVINLKTAKALGLTVPATLLARVDELIE